MKKIFVIGAHPDDIELSCFGYLLKENYTNNSKILGYIASCGSSKDKTSNKNRISESKKSFSLIKNSKLIFRNKKGIKYDDFEDLSNSIRKIILEFEPDEVLIHDPNDTHQEHVLLYRIVLSSMRKLQIKLIRYKSVSTNNNFKANLYIDINDFLNLKKKALQFHKSQHFHEYFKDFFIDSFHIDAFAVTRNLKYVESFFIDYDFN